MAAGECPAGDGRWHFWIDCGGTFIDLLAQTPTGGIRMDKVLSEAPGDADSCEKNPIIKGIRKIMDGPGPDGGGDGGRDPGLNGDSGRGAPIASIRIGTTVVTNALLERKVDRPLLAVTRGFRDVLAIGDQTRPDLFALAPRRPSHLHGEVLEIDERVDSAGRVLQELDQEAAARQLQALRTRGWHSLAVALLHSWIAPKHEEILGRLARDAGFSTVVLSCETAPCPGFVKRASGAVADAALTPVLRRYFDELKELGGLGAAEKEKGAAALSQTRIWCMQSFGGIVAAGRARGSGTVLSGPAGGVVGMALGGRAAGYERLIGFDMGGTSTDVSCFAGDFDEIAGDEVDGIYINAPMLRVHTVAAGGGSVLGHRNGRLQVGPDSAGSRPGPVCYGRGGPLTITDCHFLLGRLLPRLFRPIFGPGEDELPTLEPGRQLFADMAAELASAGGEQLTPLELAEGFIDVAVTGVVRALKRVTTARGRDPRDYALVVFGSAAGQIACRVAEELGIERMLSHPCASILSAWGIAGADIKVKRQLLIERPLNDCPWDLLTEAFDRLEREVRAEIRLQEGAGDIEVRPLVHLRPGSAEISCALDFGTRDQLQRQWRRLCRENLGLRSLGAAHAPRIVSVEVEGRVAGRRAPLPPVRPQQSAGSEPEFHEEVWIGGRWRQVPFYRRWQLPAHDGGDEEGALLRGPAMIFDDFSTFVVEPGWGAWLDRQGNLHFRRSAGATAGGTVRCDPVRLEIYNQLFMSVAEQMGELLRETAVSVNIRERRDYSCAVFAPDASLVANAHHVPVHLGAMGDSVAAVARAAATDLRAGDLWMLNSPYEGGTHLPDVTVVKPVFSGGRLFAWVGARAHHTEIGGIEPGSMPANSRFIEEEGVLIPPCRIGRDGVEDLAGTRRLFSTGPHPSRNVDGNLADLEAQLAACRRGERELQSLIERGGAGQVAAYMGFMRANAAAAVAELLRELGRRGSLFQASDELDDGTRLAVQIRIQGEADEAGGTAVFDFSGTSGPHAGNFNAPHSVVVAAVLYVLRCLIRHPMPLNSGCLDRVGIIVPRPSLLAAEAPSAVAAGNVETSQLLVDVLLRALQAAASSQGTMNNISWGNDRSQYYETICGGAGAVCGHPGLSAVHTHMTNSRLTDAELLELRYPVLLESFSIRARSGGAGRWPGGDGVCRRLLFTEPVSLSLLSGRRSRRPRGMAGGGDGACGRNLHIPRGGEPVELAGSATVKIAAGDRIEISTPGGGGWGPAEAGAQPEGRGR